MIYHHFTSRVNAAWPLSCDVLAMEPWSSGAWCTPHWCVLVQSVHPPRSDPTRSYPSPWSFRWNHLSDGYWRAETNNAELYPPSCVGLAHGRHSLHDIFETEMIKAIIPRPIYFGEKYIRRWEHPSSPLLLFYFFSVAAAIVSAACYSELYTTWIRGWFVTIRTAGTAYPLYPSKRQSVPTASSLQKVLQQLSPTTNETSTCLSSFYLAAYIDNWSSSWVIAWVFQTILVLSD